MRDNVYDNPEKFGLKVLGDIDWSDGCYQFDMTVIWQDEQGQMFYADDSGCSCPSPFEDLKGVEDLTPCSFPELQAHFDRRLEEGWNESRRDENRASMVNLLGRLRGNQGLAA